MRPIALAVAFAMIAAACGNDDDDAGTQATTEPAAEASTEDEVPQELQQVKLSLPVASLSFASTFVALGSGFFEEEGLDVDLLPYTNSAALSAQQLVQGEADIAGTGPSAVFELIAADRPIKAFATGAKINPTIITLRNEVIERLADEVDVGPDSPIQDRIDALRGLRLAVSVAGGGGQPVVRAALTEFGIDPESDLTLQGFNDPSAMVPSTLEGQVDGMIFSPPAALVPVQQGVGSVWVAGADGEIEAWVGAYQSVFAATPTFGEEQPDTLAAFRRALQKASDLMTDDPEAARASITEFFPDLDPELLELAFGHVTGSFSEGPLPDEEGYELSLEQHNLQADEPVDLRYDEAFFADLEE